MRDFIYLQINSPLLFGFNNIEYIINNIKVNKEIKIIFRNIAGCHGSLLLCYFTAHEHYQRYVANAEMLSLCDPSKERMLQNVWKKRAGFQLEIGRVVKKLQASTGYFFIKDKGVKKDESI